jgi:hypothetical protein
VPVSGRRGSLSALLIAALSLLLGTGAVVPAAQESAASALRLCADPDNLPFSSSAPTWRYSISPS